MLLSRFFRKPGSEPPRLQVIDLSSRINNNEESEEDAKLWVSGLIIIGILYCQGSPLAKAKAFFEVV